ncbi:hypothetical protein SUNI508_08136 [Seiridium unicorne]|uniref:Uncharacterized protein n=1 Tax=Seiridium unicorne TaxID=138068 RepID=A0ABR2UVN8_9PEZI
MTEPTPVWIDQKPAPVLEDQEPKPAWKDQFDFDKTFVVSSSDDVAEIYNSGERFQVRYVEIGGYKNSEYDDTPAISSTTRLRIRKDNEGRRFRYLVREAFLAARARTEGNFDCTYHLAVVSATFYHNHQSMTIPAIMLRGTERDPLVGSLPDNLKEFHDAFGLAFAQEMTNIWQWVDHLCIFTGYGRPSDEIPSQEIRRDMMLSSQKVYIYGVPAELESAQRVDKRIYSAIMEPENLKMSDLRIVQEPPPPWNNQFDPHTLFLRYEHTKEEDFTKWTEGQCMAKVLYVEKGGYKDSVYQDEPAPGFDSKVMIRKDDKGAWFRETAREMYLAAMEYTKGRFDCTYHFAVLGVVEDHGFATKHSPAILFRARTKTMQSEESDILINFSMMLSMQLNFGLHKEGFVPRGLLLYMADSRPTAATLQNMVERNQILDGEEPTHAKCYNWDRSPHNRIFPNGATPVDLLVEYSSNSDDDMHD